MPTFALMANMTLDGVSEVTPTGSEFQWSMKLQCGNCGEVTPNFVYFTADDEEEVRGSRGTANFVYKCALCEREHQVSIVAGSVKAVTESDTDVEIVQFECRGAEPVEWEPRDGFAVTSEGGARFADVDLSEDWVDFDDDAGASVGIYEVSGSFERV